MAAKAAPDFETLRKRMVKDQIRARGIRDPRVLRAMEDVPREAFTPEAYRDLAYADRPLPIGEGQTISQPYIVAFSIEALELAASDKALEVGSGCGYAAAVMARLCREVFAIERIAALADASVKTLIALGAANVSVRCGDGSKGWPEKAPFDAILVSAAAERVPSALKTQLAVGGRMVIPVGRGFFGQELLKVVRRAENEWIETPIEQVRFVPLIETGDD